MTERKAIHSENAPKAIGPYSQAMLVGSTLYISGQFGIDPATGKLVEGTAADQARRALENIEVILEKAGMSLLDVVQVQVLLADIKDFAEVNKVYKEFFSEPYPARAAYQAAALPANAKIEIIATAEK